MAHWPSRMGVAAMTQSTNFTDPTTPADFTTEDDFAPAPLRCPHCGLFYRKDQWSIEGHAEDRWHMEFILYTHCSNCGGYIEREERHHG